MEEGQDDEKVYIFLDFSACSNLERPPPGSKIVLKVKVALAMHTIHKCLIQWYACSLVITGVATNPSFVQGLDTNYPEVMILKDGKNIKGEYKDTLGSQIFLEESLSGQRAADSELQGAYPQVIGISDKTIIFKQNTEKKPPAKVNGAGPQPTKAASAQAPNALDRSTAQEV